MKQQNQPWNQQHDPIPNSGSVSRITVMPAWVWAVAAALLLGAAFTTWQAQRLAGQFAVLRRRALGEQRRSQALQSEQLRYQQTLSIVAASNTKRLQFRLAKEATQGISPSPSNGNAPAIAAYWNPQMGLVLSADKIQEMPSDRTLQLWIEPRNGAPVGAAIFRPNAQGQILMAMPPSPAMSTAKALAITDEPAGGSVQPTTTPQWIASLP